ncbi:MAG: hypothetical protein WEB58_20195 [Planctomycetaceae bacterium]|jgi:hypothetical protein
MAKLRCEISTGLRASEVVAKFDDYSGRKHFLRVEKDFLYFDNGSYFLPVAIVGIDRETDLILIELPQEAETGANRLWVSNSQLDEASIEAMA